ncbi:peptidase S28 [Cubamyces sp. BRFM 1775]|nr:peptidase S28 [Cubamyces sp. BRFM 1775]
MAFLSLFVPFLLASLVCAVASPATRPRPGMHKINVDSVEVSHRTSGAKLPPLNTTYYFDQLIDHNNPSLGTFKQRYYFGHHYYEPGGPILLMNVGEQNADGFWTYLTNETITGKLAEKYNGAVAVLEHRFFGESNPYPDLSVKSFSVHTIQQAIDDHEYFVKNVHLPMQGGDQVSGPDKAPWVLFGGSYPGALTSYTMQNKPGLFYAGYASSAVVQAIADYWRYYEPIRQNMASNCSADVQAVVSYMDQVLTSGDTSKIQAFKETFGLEGLTHNDDVASAVSQILGSWQELTLTAGAGSTWFEFCDALEVKDGKAAGPNGWGLEHALTAWGSYYKNTYISPTCGGATDSEDIAACFNTHDTSYPWWTNTTVNNAVRSWEWLLCTQFGFWQGGAPENHPTIVSRLVDTAYFQRQCMNYFPEAFSSPPVVLLDALDVNKLYGGWNTTTERLFFLNGIRDPWREATVAADGATTPGSDLQPHLLGDGYHCSDMLISEGISSPAVLKVQNTVVDYLGKWLAEWKPSSA